MFTYPSPSFRLKERIYENSDKSIAIFKTRKRQEIRYIAVKLYNKSRQSSYNKEYEILKDINNPSIIRVFGASEDKNNFFMEEEFCISGDLSKCLWPNKGSLYMEKVIKSVSVQLLLGLKELHLKGIIHCNLKPTNIVIDEYGNVKICDFKKALKVNEMTIADIRKNKTAMTPCYTAPELFSDDGAYSFKTDLWALGCIMYEMAVGQVPFFDEVVNKLIKKIINDDVNFNKRQLSQYSMEFSEILKKLLEKNPELRPGWGEVEKFPFWELNEYNNNNNNSGSISNSNSDSRLDTIVNNNNNNNNNNRNSSMSNINNNNNNYFNNNNYNNNNYNNVTNPNSNVNSINKNEIKQLQSASSSGSLLIYDSKNRSSSKNLHNNMNLNNNNNNNINNFEVMDNDDDYSNSNTNQRQINNTNEEFNFHKKNSPNSINITNNNNNNNNNNNINEDSSYTSSKLQKLNNLNKKSLNTLSVSVLNISKIMDKHDKRVFKNSINDMQLSLSKIDEIPQLNSIMIHQSDKSVKPIIGNKIIEQPKIAIYDVNLLQFKPVWKIDKIKELLINDNYEELENYLLNIYTLMDEYSKNNQQEFLLNLLNYFETIILSKEVSNNIINTSFSQLIISFLDINNDQIRIRSCSIIAYLIRYATTMENSLDKYNLTENLISFISDNNLELNRKAIATLGEYLFFVATQVEGENEDDGDNNNNNNNENNNNNNNNNNNSNEKMWSISQESLIALLFALNHSDEKVRFYSLKTIENISTLTTVAKNYFAQNEDFISKIIDIYYESCENPEIHTSALSTCSYLIKLEPNLLKVFIEKMDTLNNVIDKETPKNQQCIINCLLFGIVEDNNNNNYVGNNNNFNFNNNNNNNNKNENNNNNNNDKNNNNNNNNIKIINFDDVLPSLINLLESGNNVIKSKIILLLSLIFNDNEVIEKYGEKVFELMQKLRKEKNNFYYYVKIFESFMVNYCNKMSKYFISIFNNNNNNNNNEIFSLLKIFHIISPYHKISYILFKKDFLEVLLKILYQIKHLELSFEILKSFSENPFCVEENSDYIINFLFENILKLTSLISSDFKRFPLNICANILTVILDDEKLYSSTEINLSKTNQINSLIITILPKITDLLKQNDTVNDTLSFLSLIIERNSAFIRFYRSVGIIDYVFFLMKDDNFYYNLNLLKILIKLIESNDTQFNDIIDLNLIEKVNYMINKDNIDDINNDITIYTEYVMEMLYDLMFKINESKKKFNRDFDKNEYKKNFVSKIEKITVNFKLCIKLLACNNTNLQEKSCVCIIFMLQLFPEGFNENQNFSVKFKEDDIPNLLKGLDTNSKKIHKKMIKIFKWIIQYQNDAVNLLKNYVSYIQIYIEKIKDTSTDPSVIEVATKFLESDLKKII